MHVLSFSDRASALENLFFQEVDQQLREKIRNELAEQEAKAALRAASGIADEELLSELLQIEVRPETLAAVTLIPLVAIAWADGKVTDAERDKILMAEQDVEIAEESPSHRLLSHWLDTNPGDALLTTWKHYVVQLRDRLTPAANELFHKGLFKRAEAVARISGGYLTYGSISPSEQRILSEVKKTIQAANQN